MVLNLKNLKGITIDPMIRSGVPVVKNTRVPVSLILANLIAGMSFAEIAEDLSLDLHVLKLALQDLIVNLFEVENGPDGVL